MKTGFCAFVGVLGLSLTAPAQMQAEFEVVSLELYVMSKCPFATQLEDALFPLLARFGKSVELALEFVGSEQDGVLGALHGEPELVGNKIQLCASRYHPGEYRKLIQCMNKNMPGIPDGWERCAKNAGISVADVKNCAEGQEGTGLLRYSYHKARDRRALGSPTIYINEKMYRGGRSQRALTQAICGAFRRVKPDLCLKIPPPPKVEVLLLSDRRCRDCRTEQLVEALEGMFIGARVEVVDYAAPKGQQLYALIKPEPLPALFFNQEVKNAEGYDRIQFRVQEKGDYLYVPTGGSFDPTREVCDNQIDDTGNGKVDCQDPDCQQTLACREEVPGQLQVFIMSQCPFCSKGLDVMKPILERFGRDFSFEIHYIAQQDGDGFRSLHGQSEVDENIRGLCVMKHHPEPKNFLKYFWCRMEDIRSEDWKPCTGKNGIDTKKVEECFNSEEGKNLLRRDIPIADALEIYGSPTWLVNNRHKFNGIHLEVILENFCRHNQGLKGCRGVGAK